MTDEDIIKTFKTKRYRVNPNLLKQYISENGNRYNNEIKKYIESRYEDSFSFEESTYRIVEGIEVHPKCPVCGNLIPFHISSYKLFNDTCSPSCSSKLNYKLYIDNESIESAKETRKKTMNEKYGVDNPFQIPSIKTNILNKHLLLYNADEYIKKKKNIVKKTNQYFQNTYGCNPNQLEEIKEKKRQTNIHKFGTPCPLQNEEVAQKAKKAMIKKYGVPNYSNSIHRKKRVEQIKSKIYNTMKERNSFKYSKAEEELYSYIKMKFPDVCRQYKDKERYPYNCDFYIPTLDLFIEYQGYYTHNTHPYNDNDIEDRKKVEEYKEKYGPECQAITIWTIKDVEKRNCAKKHNLNFKEVWNINEAKKFIDSI